MIKNFSLLLLLALGAISAPANAAVVILDSANGFSFELENNATISALTFSDGAGVLSGNGIVFAPGSPDVADFNCSDPTIGQGGCTGRPQDLIAGGLTLTALVQSSGNKYALDLITFKSRRSGCVDGDQGISCVASDGFTSFNISAPVPEPETWAFMIFGFGAIGGAMRRQRKVSYYA